MILCSIVYFVLRKSQLTVVGNIFRNLDDALGSSSWHMKATQTNMEEGEGDTERGNSEQEDSDQPRQNEELVPKRGATSVAWTWFGYEKSDTDQTNVFCKVCRRPVPSTDSNTTNLFQHLRKNHVKQYAESPTMIYPTMIYLFCLRHFGCFHIMLL